MVCPWDADFTGMQNPIVTGSGRLPLGFQRKVWEARQEAPEKDMGEAVGMKPKVHWRPEEVRDAENTEHLLRKAVPQE